MKTAITSLIRRLVGTPGLDSRIARIEQALQQKHEVPQPAPPTRTLCGSMTEVRKTVADNFIAGQGLEIGAFASPLPVPAAARVTYVDKYKLEDLDANHKVVGLSLGDFGVDLSTVVRPDIVDDGECLAKVGDYSQDFVIANHVLEHFEDPIKGFRNMLRVLKHGGILYLSLPEMRHSFDSVRQPTPFEHLQRDYEEGPAWSRDSAYAEFAKIFAANGMDKGLFPRHSGAALKQFENEIAQELNAADYSIHFHAWTMEGMVDMFSRIKPLYRLAYETRLILKNKEEVIFIFEKTVPHIA